MDKLVKKMVISIFDDYLMGMSKDRMMNILKKEKNPQMYLQN